MLTPTVETGSKEPRHIQIDRATREIERVWVDLADLVAKVKGEQPRERPVPVLEPTPSLNVVLTDTPTRLFQVRDQIQVCLKELHDLLF